MLDEETKKARGELNRLHRKELSQQSCVSVVRAIRWTGDEARRSLDEFFALPENPGLPDQSRPLI